MPLTSPRFASNQRLQKVAQNAPPMKWGEKGDAVAIVQQAFIELGFPMPVSTRKTGKPDGIFGQETYNTTKKFQQKHTLSIDGVVGKQTMGRLDQLIRTPAPQPARPGAKPRFEAASKNNGFDESVTPRWQMVPRGGTKIVRLMDGDGLSVVSVNPAVVTVSEVNKCFVHGGREFELKGIAKGKAVIEARQGTTVKTKLEVDVKNKKTVKVAFNFVSDNAGHKTSRSHASVPNFVQELNKIFLPQANIEIVKHGPRNVRVNKNLGAVVRFVGTRLRRQGVPASEHEWDDVTALGDRTADFNLFFVWEYEQDISPNTDNTGGGTSGGNCLLEDNLQGSHVRNIGHELGHHLGCNDDYSAAHKPWLLYGYEDGGTQIPKAHAIIMNNL